MKIDFDKNFSIIPPDATRGFVDLPVKKSRNKNMVGILAIMLMILISGLAFLLVQINQQASNTPRVVYSANNLGVSIINEIYLPDREFPDLQDWGKHCDKNSQAPLTGLKGENSSCNLEPKVKEGKYIDVDLTKMLLRTYLNGILVKEYKITARGNPKSVLAARTPTGNFSALLKEPKHFSRLYYVWMPWSVEFNAGGYFLHGVPYFSNGQTISTFYSGGCIRINTEQMKEIYDFVDIGIPIIIYE